MTLPQTISDGTLDRGGMMQKLLNQPHVQLGLPCPQEQCEADILVFQECGVYVADILKVYKNVLGNRVH